MHRMFIRALLVAAAASTAAWGQSREPHAAPTGSHEQRQIDPRADAAIRRMSEYLAGLRTMRVDTRAVDEVVLPSGQKIQQVSETRLSVARPNKVHSQRMGPDQDVDFRYNGRAFNVSSASRGLYASVDAPPSIDDAVQVLRDRYGIEVPAADLLSSRPYDALMHDVRSGQYIGLEPIGGVQTHHLAFSGPEVDWQIWIRDGNEPVPVRFVITSKTAPSHPQFAVDLDHWSANPRLAGNEFEYTPPASARRIQILPVHAGATGERQGR